MSCISSNFSSFFLNSLNDPSEFSKYLSNGELRFSSTFEDFPVYGQNSQQQQQQYQQQQHIINGGVLHANGELDDGNSNIENTQPMLYGSYQTQQQQTNSQLPQQQRWITSVNPHQQQIHIVSQQHLAPAANNTSAATAGGATTGSQHFDGSFEFMKYLRHSNDYNENSHDGQNSTASNSSVAIGTKPDAASLSAANAASLMDLDNAHKRSASRKTPLLSSANSNHSSTSATNNSHPTPMAIDMYDHDSKHTIFDLHHMNSVHSSNSNESSMELSSMTYPNSHLNASNSNTSSEGGTNAGHSDFSMLGVASTQSSTSTTATAAAASPAAPKPLASFSIKDNFDAHPSHKVEEGIFQHMNKLPSKKKDTLKQLGVRFTGQMTLNDKSIIVENFIKFCQEYDVTDHRPFLSLNQSGLNKPDQIKFARYLGQGLPTFTLFCIYSNFKNLFCTKRTEIYTKDGYNLPYILDKTKRFLANTTAGNNNNNNASSNSSSNNNTATTTTVTASSSNINSLNTNSNPNNTTTNNTTLKNNVQTVGNNAVAAAVPVVATDMQNGSSNSSSGGNINNDIINTATKQIHNVPSASPATPPQQIQQQMPQIPIQTQNTPLPAHPPISHPHPHTMTPPTQHPTHVQQHHQQRHPQQQQHHHHVQMPMSPMMGSPLPPPPPPPPSATTAVATVVTQSTTNHHHQQHPLQHPHHVQPNNHLNLHPHPPSPLSHHVRHLAAPLIQQQQHPDHATAVAAAGASATPNNYQQQQHMQQHHHQQQQIHHPLHNLAAQNPPL